MDEAVVKLGLADLQRKTRDWSLGGIPNFREIPEEDWASPIHHMALECLVCHEIFFERNRNWKYCPKHRAKKQIHSARIKAGMSRVNPKVTQSGAFAKRP